MNNNNKNKQHVTELKPRLTYHLLLTLSALAFLLGASSSVYGQVCAANPCENGGTCIQKEDSFTCACVTPWFGNICTFYNDTTFPCAVNEFVSSNSCQACAAGSTNEAGDDAFGIDTQCDATLCAADEYVASNACTACPAGTTNAAGDDASGSDTLCDPPLLKDGFEAIVFDQPTVLARAYIDANINGVYDGEVDIDIAWVEDTNRDGKAGAEDKTFFSQFPTKFRPCNPGVVGTMDVETIDCSGAIGNFDIDAVTAAGISRSGAQLTVTASEGGYTIKFAGSTDFHELEVTQTTAAGVVTKPIQLWWQTLGNISKILTNYIRVVTDECGTAGLCFPGEDEGKIDSKTYSSNCEGGCNFLFLLIDTSFMRVEIYPDAST